MDDKPDFASTTAVIAYVRKRITPRILWSAIGALVTALMVCITWIVTTQSAIHELNDHDAELRRAMVELKAQVEVLHEIHTQLAVMAGKMDSIADEVERQREWREKIEGVAELPPHARRRQ